ncbi:hypothetical protein BGX24_010831 [Mortierella sp. AD032]|nr:hypothetical protein BGX24_010831 [Mortierella sp. AD032]
MRIAYKGATKCYLALDTIAKCNCLTCTFFAQFETSRFKDDKDCAYAVIAMDEFEKVLDFQVCPSHQMRMNLIPWADREEARSADMDLLIHGGQRDTKWVNSMIIDGVICQLAVEILSIEALVVTAAPSEVYSQNLIHPPTLQEQQQYQQYAHQYQQQQQQYQLKYPQRQRDFLQECLQQAHF